MFIKKKLKYFTRQKQISPDLSGVFQIVCIHVNVPLMVKINVALRTDLSEIWEQKS